MFVLTPYAREPLAREGGTTFTFVTEGIEAALGEMEINLVPTLLGGGERLFESTGDDLRGLELVRTIATPRVVHLKFARR